MGGNTEKIEKLLERRRKFEDELERLQAERASLGKQIEGVLDKKASVDRELAAILELDVPIHRLSVRQALKEVLKSTGTDGLTIDEICDRVWRKANKGTRGTILSYLEREEFSEGVPQSGKWRMKGA